MWDQSLPCDEAEARQQEAVEAVQHSEEAAAKTPEAGIRQIVTAAESKIQLRPFKALNAVVFSLVVFKYPPRFRF